MTVTTRLDKEAIRAQLRALRGDLKIWTLKAPGLHFDETIVCPTRRGQLRGGKPVLCQDGERGTCEGCGMTLHRADRADRIGAEIHALTERMNGTPKPEATREAVVMTGSGEQLVIFA